MHIISVMFVYYLQCGDAETRPKEMLGGQFYDGRKIVIPLAENASIQLLNHWIQQATSGFMAAFASRK
ncbi:unnamed protein product [Gongylonema pulchrum]|uniref:Transposase n=1 Tax=Gongylonema pulchrum TaxID=637853 RepID=A0A183DZW7_9BILA|nr:unnamed protein product [Gongylonema pulchrum]